MADVKLVVKDGDKVYELDVEKLGVLVKSYGKEIEEDGVFEKVLKWFD